MKVTRNAISTFKSYLHTTWRDACVHDKVLDERYPAVLHMISSRPKTRSAIPQLLGHRVTVQLDCGTDTKSCVDRGWQRENDSLVIDNEPKLLPMPASQSAFGNPACHNIVTFTYLVCGSHQLQSKLASGYKKCDNRHEKGS